MKTILFSLLIFTTFVTLYSCQDEFCVDATTPQLIIKFYDKDEITKTKSIDLVAWTGEETNQVYTGTAVDSILIPLNTQTNSVIYHFSILDSLGSQEDITINYTVEDVYVSKACGFKSVFNNLTIETTTNNWLTKTETLLNNIKNENETHVKILH